MGGRSFFRPTTPLALALALALPLAAGTPGAAATRGATRSAHLAPARRGRGEAGGANQPPPLPPPSRHRRAPRHFQPQTRQNAFLTLRPYRHYDRAGRLTSHSSEGVLPESVEDGSVPASSPSAVEEEGGEEDSEAIVFKGDIGPMELHPLEIEGQDIHIARPRGIDDTILEVAASGGDLEEFFWAFVWPAATALSREFRRRPELVKGKKVCEIGAGLGIAGLTAAVEGAEKVVLLDHKIEALTCAMMTAQINGVSVEPSPDIPGFRTVEEAEERIFGETMSQNDDNREAFGKVSARHFDWNSMDPNGPEERFDVIILGDVFYGSSVVRKLQEQIPRMLNPGGCIIIAGGSLDVNELNFVGTMTSQGFGLEEVAKRDVQREWDVQMEDPNGSLVHMVRLREGYVNKNLSGDQDGQSLESLLSEQDDEDLDEIDMDSLKQ